MASNPTQTAESTVGTPVEELFPSSPPHQGCSWNRCTGGHKWPVTLLVAKCPGCGGAVLAVKKENCPYCNEPTKEMSLRSDYLPRGTGVAPRCKGVPVPGDSLDITLERTHWQEAEEKTRFYHERTEKHEEG